MNQKPNSHHLGYGAQAKTLAALLILTALTVYASRLDFGALNIFIALAIAAAKAALVSLFFMEIIHETRLIKTTFLITLGMLSLTIALMLVDVLNR